MFKKIGKLFLLAILVFTLTACGKSDGALFKKDYESLNGVQNSNGKEHRSVTIPKNNPMVLSSAKEVVEMIENGETFYVYFGSKLCPWCRSVIEKAIEVANDNEIDKIYYVDIWDDDGNEILRDKYTLDDDGNSVKVNEGTEEYYKLLDYLNDYLSDYTYDEKLNLTEKRIYAPTYIYIANGAPARMTTGLSNLQTDSREELTDEILQDEQALFDDFFINICDESC